MRCDLYELTCWAVGGLPGPAAFKHLWIEQVECCCLLFLSGLFPTCKFSSRGEERQAAAGSA